MKTSTFARSIAVFYGMLALMGMIPQLNTVFGWLPIHGNDILLHAATAALAAYFGWRNEIVHEERRSLRKDRRHDLQPVMRERRSGFPDRRLAAGM
jgi:hypothetical protein